MTIDAKILTALRTVASGGISGSDLAQQLEISRAAVWARIEDLRALGYEIEASPHQGYRLVTEPNVLHADNLLSRWPTAKVIGRDIRVFQETTSTSDIVEKLALDGVKEGIVVFAESQTQGRGRLGRKWWSLPGKSLLFSVLLRPDLRPQAATQLVVAAAVSLARASHQQTGLEADIKWPNDILLRGKKVAGILTELSAELDHIKHVILGIGVDVNQTPADFHGEIRKSATSLKMETGAEVNRAALATAIMQALDQDYARVRAGQFAALASEWGQRCSTLGRRVTIRVGDRLIQGRAEALDHAGALLVRTQFGRLETIIGGDVTLEK